MAVLCGRCDWIHHRRRSAGMGGTLAAIGELTLLRCITVVAKFRKSSQHS